MKFLFCLVLVLSLKICNVQSQPLTNYHHNTFWGRVVLADKVTPKIRWELFLQDRTQNDPENRANIFKHHQLTSYWLWLHYQVTKDLRISVSPFCYFNTISLYPQPVDVGNRGVAEYRWAVQAEQTQKFKGFTYANRYSVEYRQRDLVTEGVYVGNFRVRYRAKLEKPFGNEKRPVTLIIYDELFLEFGKAVNGSSAIFNQNRLYGGFSYEVLKNVKFTLGYMYLVQERPSGRQVDNVNVLWGILTFENVFSQFYQRDKEKDKVE